MELRIDGKLAVGNQAIACSCNRAVTTRLQDGLASQRDIAEIARTVYAKLAPELDARIWLMGIYNGATQTVNVVWQMHSGQELPGGSFPLGNGVTSQVIRSRQSKLIRQWSREGPPIRVQYATSGSPGLPESSITVPIVFADVVLGVLSVQDYCPRAFDQDALELLENAARYVAPALWNCLAETDHPIRASHLCHANDGASTMVLSGAHLTVNRQGEVLGLNHAARRLLDMYADGITFGHHSILQWCTRTATLGQRSLRHLDERFRSSGCIGIPFRFRSQTGNARALR